jgi:hypothetical protein
VFRVLGYMLMQARGRQRIEYRAFRNAEFVWTFRLSATLTDLRRNAEDGFIEQVS